MQESVFECWLSAHERGTLWQRLTALIEPDSDRLRLHALSRAERTEILSLGPGGTSPAPGSLIL